ncbi:hypothetical protein, partial [Nostoc flagelliforme]|uniref:hypothetical protein n=1 Tax=Nostoc flagelliforme TaxID=1306274 RepID=UPI001A7E3941
SFRPSCSLLTCSDVKKFLAAGGIVAFKRLPLLIMQLKCRLAYCSILAMRDVFAIESVIRAKYEYQLVLNQMR